MFPCCRRVPGDMQAIEQRLDSVVHLILICLPKAPDFAIIWRCYLIISHLYALRCTHESKRATPVFILNIVEITDRACGNVGKSRRFLRDFPKQLREAALFAGFRRCGISIRREFRLHPIHR
jgi:hypothetical protein